MISYSIILTHKADEDEATIFQYISDEFGREVQRKTNSIFSFVTKTTFHRPTSKKLPHSQSLYFQQAK